MSPSDSRRAFFRQGAWIAAATVLGGGFNIASNLIAQRMPGGEFNTFDTAFSALGIFGIPAVGMQAALAAQSAGADTEERQRALTATMRGALLMLGIIWLGLAAGSAVWRNQISAAYHVTHPGMLVLLVMSCLVTLVTPVPFGVLQGRQDFLWFGWATLLNGVGRFVVLALVVLGLKLGAVGAVAGVFAGSVAVLAIVSWRTWGVFSVSPGRFDWRDLLRRLLPTTLGLGVLTFMMQADGLVVREKLYPMLSPDEIDGYSAVRKVGQGLYFVIVALVSVMFPKVAKSFHRAERSDAFRLTFGLTLAIAVVGAVVAWVWPELPLYVSPRRLMESKSLVPWYCSALVFLALSNVVVWNLLARECFRIVPWLCVLALGYWYALRTFGDSRLAFIQVMGVFNALVLAVSGVFVWLDARQPLKGHETRIGPGSPA